MYPEFDAAVKKASDIHSHKITTASFKDMKRRLLVLEHSLGDLSDADEDERQKLVDRILRGDLSTDRRANEWYLGRVVATFADAARSFIPVKTFANQPKESGEMIIDADTISDSDFLARLSAMVDKFPVMAPAVGSCLDDAHQVLAQAVKKKSHELARSSEQAQLSSVRHQLKLQAGAALQTELEALRRRYLDDVWDAFVDDAEQYVISIHIIDSC